MLSAPLTFHIGLNAARKNAGNWGDMPYAMSLAGALRAQGAQARLFYRGERPTPDGQGDVVLRLVGPTLDEPVAGLPNLLWVISPPNLMVAPVLQRYQKIFVASEPLVQRLSALGVEAENLPQVSDPALFHPGKRPAGAPLLPIVFVGGYAARARRPAVIDAIAAGLEVHVWGPGWRDVIPARNWQGARIEQGELAALYARARIVLNAHMPQMAFHGMMSNRSYDALAAGAVVVSDIVQGFEAPDLPDLIQIAPGPEQIALLQRLLAAPEEDFQTRMARHEQIAKTHSFEHAAAQIIAAAREVQRSGAVTPPAFCPRGEGMAPPVTLSPVARSAPLQHDGLMGAAREIAQIFTALEYPERPPVTPPAPLPPEEEGVLHALMPDLRRAQRLILKTPPVPPRPDQIETLHRARRVLESGRDIAPAGSSGRDATVTRLMRGAPSWYQAPEDHSRDDLKRHVVLWPRKAPRGVFAPLLSRAWPDLCPASGADQRASGDLYFDRSRGQSRRPARRFPGCRDPRHG